MLQKKNLKNKKRINIYDLKKFIGEKKNKNKNNKNF